MSHRALRLPGYYGSLADQFLHRSRDAQAFISHAPSIGNANEAILRDFLSGIVPRRYEVGQGFAYHSRDKVSGQCDILIYDRLDYAPLFRAGNFVVIPPEAVRIIIQVKTELNREETQTAFDNIGLAKSVVGECSSEVMGIIFAFDAGRLNRTLKGVGYCRRMTHQVAPDVIIALRQPHALIRLGPRSTRFRVHRASTNVIMIVLVAEILAALSKPGKSRVLDVIGRDLGHDLKIETSKKTIGIGQFNRT